MSSSHIDEHTGQIVILPSLLLVNIFHLDKPWFHLYLLIHCNCSLSLLLSGFILLQVFASMLVPLPLIRSGWVVVAVVVVMVVVMEEVRDLYR